MGQGVGSTSKADSSRTGYAAVGLVVARCGRPSSGRSQLANHPPAAHTATHPPQCHTPASGQDPRHPQHAPESVTSAQQLYSRGATVTSSSSCTGAAVLSPSWGCGEAGAGHIGPGGDWVVWRQAGEWKNG